MEGQGRRQILLPCGGMGLGGIGLGFEPGQARAANGARRSGMKASQRSAKGRYVWKTRRADFGGTEPPSSKRRQCIEGRGRRW